MAPPCAQRGIYLCTVEEIAELGLPDGKERWTLPADTVLEPKDTELAQRA